MKKSILIFVILCASVVSLAALGNGSYDLNKKVSLYVALVKSRTESGTQGDAARQVAMLVSRLNQTEVDKLTDDTVDKVSELLESKNEIVRLYAASALGYMGRRGTRALPALRRADVAEGVFASNSGVVVQSVNSAGAIRAAIARIEAGKIYSASPE